MASISVNINSAQQPSTALMTFVTHSSGLGRASQTSTAAAQHLYVPSSCCNPPPQSLNRRPFQRHAQQLTSHQQHSLS